MRFTTFPTWRGNTRRTLWIAFAIVALQSTNARADDATAKALAQSLFEEGRTLMLAGRYAEACPKFVESQRLDPGGGTLLNLATCREGEGKIATAWALYHEAVSQAIRDGRLERAEKSRERIGILTPRLPRVRLSVHPTTRAIAGLEIKLDGVVFPNGAWDTPFPIDPGAHRLTAEAPGFSTWTMAVDSIREAETKTVEVPYLPSLASAAPTTLASSSSTSPPAVRYRTNPAFWVVLAGTSAAALTGIVTGIMWTTTSVEVVAKCDNARSFCSGDGLDAANRKELYGWVNVISFGLAAAGGISLAFVPPKVPEHSSSQKGSIRVVPGFGAASIVGTF